MELTRMPKDNQLGYLECINFTTKGVVTVYEKNEPIGIILFDSNENSWYFITGIDSINESTLANDYFMGLVEAIEQDYTNVSFTLTQFK